MIGHPTLDAPPRQSGMDSVDQDDPSEPDQRRRRKDIHLQQYGAPGDQTGPDQSKDDLNEGRARRRVADHSLIIRPVCMKTKLLAVALLLSACAKEKKPEPVKPDYTRMLPPGKLALEKVKDPPDFRPGFTSRGDLRTAVDRSLVYFEKPSSKNYYPYAEITHAQVVASLRRFREVLDEARSADDFHRTLVREFDVYRSVGWDGNGTVFFTGYCAPIYDASLEPSAEFAYPLYRRPPDLVTDPEGVPLGRRTDDGEIVPYYTREEIERDNLLAGHEFVWLRDRFECYIVQIQGSARLRMRDGSLLDIGYAGKTDRPYQSAALAMIEAGVLTRESLSLQGMKSHFRRRPADLDRYLRVNESFVFFTETSGGPFGSLGAPVTPYASIATDKAVFPRGALSYVMTELPDGAHRAFALDQDTGGAIRSAGRCDLYLGVGPEAEELAGRVGREGKLYYLFLKPEAVPASSPR